MAVTSAYVGPSGSTIAVVAETDITAISLGQIYTALVLGASGASSFVLPGGSATVPIGATPSAVQTLLEAVVGTGDVQVAGFAPYKITFAEAQASFSVNTSGLSSTRSTDPTTAGTSPLSEVTYSTYVGTWTRTYGSYVGGELWSNAGDGDSGSYMKWTKTGLSTGNYKIYTGWSGDPSRATDAKYRIYDGTTLVNVVPVDQTYVIPNNSTNKPSGYTYVSVLFLANVYVSSGTLNVYLCDDCNGTINATGFVVEPYAPSVANTPYNQSVSQTVTPVGSPGYTVNGGSSVPFGGPPIWSRAGDQNYAVFLLGETLDSNDVVQVSLPAGSVTLSDGLIEATSLTATNRAGGKILDAFDSTAVRTFKVGWNIAAPSYYDVHQMFNNVVRGGRPMGAISGLTAPTYDDDRNVTSGSAGGLLRTGQVNPIDDQGYRNLPTGTYTIKFKGAGNVYLTDGPTNRTDLGTVGGYRTITYDVAATGDTATVDLYVRVDGPVTDLALYPPGCRHVRTGRILAPVSDAARRRLLPADDGVFRGHLQHPDRRVRFHARHPGAVGRRRELQVHVHGHGRRALR